MIRVISAIMMTLCMCEAAAAADQKPRLAVLASDEAQTKAIVALVEVSLSARDDVDLIDRDQVDKILAEHHLQSKNIVSNDDRLSTARLLGCEVFVDLLAGDAAPVENVADLLPVRAMDARTGARLIDVTIESNLTLEGKAAAVSDAVSAALQKLKNGEVGKGVPVSISTIRDAGLPVAYRDLPAKLLPMLERYLLMSPSISVLDRERLGLLNREAEIAEDTRQHLLASAVMLEIDISPAMDGNIRMRASLNNMEGKEIGHATAEGEWNAYISVLVELVSAIAKELKTTSIEPSADVLIQEAARYARRDPEVAVALAEAALARNPTNEIFQHRAILFHASRLRNIDDSPRALDELERCIDLLEMGSHDHVLIKYSRPDGRTGRIPSKIGYSIQDAVENVASRVLNASGDGAYRLRELRRRILMWHRKTRAENANVMNPQLLVAATGNIHQYMDEIVFLWKSRNIAPKHFSIYPGAGSVLGMGGAEDLSDEHKIQLMDLYEYWAENREMKSRDQLDLQFICLRWAYANKSLFTNYDEIVKRHLAAARDLVLASPPLVAEFGRYISRTHNGEDVPSVDPMIDINPLVNTMRELLIAMRQARIACPDILVALDWYDPNGADYPGAYLDEAILQQQNQDYSITSPWYHWREGRSRQGSRNDFVKALNELKTLRYGNVIQPGLSTTNRIEKIPLFAFPEKEPSNDPVKIIVAPTPYEHASIRAAARHNEFVYLTLVDGDTHRIGLIACNLQSGDIRSLGSMPSTKIRDVRSIQITARHACVLTDNGLIVFPLEAGGDGWILNETSGLPANDINAFCEYGDTFYIACSREKSGQWDHIRDSFLVRCRFDGADMQILAASTRREQQSPLDNRFNFLISHMITDSANHRVLFSITGHSSLNLGGIWQCDVKTGKIERVIVDVSYPLLLGKNQNDEFVIKQNNNGLVWFAWKPGEEKHELMSMKTSVAPTFHSVVAADLPVGFPLFEDVLFLPQENAPRKFGGSYSPAQGTRWKMCRMSSDTLTFETILPAIDQYSPFYLTRFDDKLIACTGRGLYALDPDAIAVGAEHEAHPASGEEVSDASELSVVSETGGILTLDDRSYKLWPRRPLHWKSLKAGAHRVSLDWCGKKWGGIFDLKPGEKTELTGFPDEKPEKTFVLDMGKSVSMRFVWIPAGERSIGGDEDRHKQPTIIHIEKGFWMGQYEVTVNQHRRVVEPDTPVYDDENYPVVGLSWENAVSFYETFNQAYAEQLKGMSVRLPSREEWEYAYFAGTKTRFYFGDSEEDWDLAGHFGRFPVGARMPNLYWLYDMAGNAQEWCYELDVANKAVGTVSSYHWRSAGKRIYASPPGSGVRLILETN